MLQTARNTVCSKGKHFIRPRSISLFSLSLRGCPVKSRTRVPIVSMAQSWVYPSFSSSPHGRIGWHTTATSPFWLAPTTTWLVSITTSSLFGLRPRSITACLWEDGIALFPSSFRAFCQTAGRVHVAQAPPGFSLGGPGNPRADCAGTLLWWSPLCLIFCVSFCLDECAMGFPDSSCLFFDLIPFVYLLS